MKPAIKCDSEWFTRGYLPHRDRIGLRQSITFRLADSLPQSQLEMLEHEFKNLSAQRQSIERRRKVESWLDAGIGCCALRNPEVAEYLQNAMLHFHGDRYILLAWCIMPNHVHVVIEPRIEISKIVQGWKSYSSRWVLAQNERLNLNVPNRDTLWMREYWDRYIRDEKHLESAISYFHQNPVKAGLCDAVEDWRWSSAFPENAERIGRTIEKW